MSPNNCYSHHVGRKNRKAEKQRFDKNFLISPGMSKSEVLDIMGQPVASEFEKNVEEWHYCATGIGSDEFVSFFFENGKVISKTTYTVTIEDTGGVTGPCRKFIKRGSFQMPDRVLEIRAKITEN